MKLKIYAVFLAALFASCASQSQVTQPQKTKFAHKREFIENLKASYPNYSLLSAGFKLKGKQDNKNFFFTGKLESRMQNNTRQVSVRLLDAVFASLVFSMEINGNNVTLTDHMKKKTETLNLKDLYLVQLFGSYFPLQFLLPFLYGSYPEELTSKSAKVDYENGLIEYKAKEFLLNAHTQDNVINSFTYRDLYSGSITQVTLSGRLKNKDNIYFPKSIRITNESTKEFATVDFDFVKVEPPGS